MEASAGMVAGCHKKNELVWIRHDSSDSGDLNGKICQICEDNVGLTSTGDVFVACNECGFPVCHACYEYERKDGNQCCPHCKTRYKRHRGSAQVEGDDEEDDVDDIDNEFNNAKGNDKARSQWEDDVELSSSRHDYQQPIPLLTNGQTMSGEILRATPDTESDCEGEPSQLPPVDIFVSTVDPLEEPPLVTANTVLSILAADYPVDKVSCYVSDEGSAMLTLEALSETVEIAKKWVPFCKKNNIMPRAPESYFSQKIDYLKDKVQPSFVKERRAMKREYEEFKVNINALVYKALKTPKEGGWTMQDGTPWPGNNPRDHPGMIKEFLGNELPRLYYVSREKRPGFEDHEEDGAMNALIRVSAVLTNGAYLLNVDFDQYFSNSKALKEAMCYTTDPLDGIGWYDPYANRKIVFVDGPVFMGTGCCFNRQALYGYPVLTEGVEGYDEERSLLLSQKSLEKRFGQSALFIATTFMERGGILPSTNPATVLNEALHVISCSYEEKTEWGKKIGWRYGSVREDISTGFKMHARDWIWLLRGAFYVLVFICFLKQRFGNYK